MKRFLLVVTVILSTFGYSALAQNNSVPITGGRFFMQRGVSSTSNARIETANFTATSWVSDNYGTSPWDICSLTSNPTFCQSGTTFGVPDFPNSVPLGFCGACNPSQFPFGTFTLNGTTYESAYFSGNFQFSQARFTVSPSFLTKRKGFVRFRKPFTMTGDLRVCRTVSEFGCRTEDIIYRGQITGHGTLTVTTKVVVDNQISSRPFLFRESIEYQFEP